jgi:16S rRNA (cytidine1402-2'-O)-methyltransferase
MEKGKLYIVATPIGNMDDISYRAVKVLREEADIIICEDTRQSGKILNNFSIKKPRTSLHSHTGQEKIRNICKEITEGKSAAYLTDSGTPSISDPGSRLVSCARSMDIDIIPIPGPSALTSIISVAGFPEKRVIFTGFLSKKEGKMKRELLEIKNIPGIIVIYESPYRIKKLLKILAEIFPDSSMIIGREMTKFYEEFYTGKAGELWEKSDEIREKGEFTIALLNRAGQNNT